MASGGDCCCADPQFDSTPRVSPESAELLRATMDVPRIIQAQVVKRKMRTMAAMCFPIPASSVPNVAIVWPARGEAGASIQCRFRGSPFPLPPLIPIGHGLGD